MCNISEEVPKNIHEETSTIVPEAEGTMMIEGTNKESNMMIEEASNNIITEVASSMVTEDASTITLEAEGTMNIDETRNRIDEASKVRSAQTINVITNEENNTMAEEASNMTREEVNIMAAEEERNTINDEVSDELSKRRSSEANSTSNEHTYEPERFRKLFVGGLNYTSTKKTLESHFEKWGDIIDCTVIRDPRTKKSKGYGFVTYKASHMIDDAQGARPHKIDGREVKTQRAVPIQDSVEFEERITTKILLVGRLKDNIEEQDLREYFGKYGKITGVKVVTDNSTGKGKGFAFIGFNDYDPVDKIILVRYHSLKGKTVQVQKYLPKQDRATRMPLGLVVLI